MEGCLALAAVAVLLGPPALAIAVWVRLQRLEGRIEGRLAALERALAAGGPGARAGQGDPAPPLPAGAATPEPAGPVLESGGGLPPPPPAPAPPPEPPTAPPSRPAALPRPSTGAPTSRPEAPPSPSARIDWERWLGVRGAALLGGILLALAGLLFFQYSIERGLISPPVRVIAGVAVGLALIVVSERLRPGGYRGTADALAGAAIVVLYAAIWAAGVLYGLVPRPAVWIAMGIVTVGAGAIAVKRDALTVAILGLVGGFATPLLLGEPAGRPAGLFGYLLLLDLGLLAAARVRRWPSVALLALLGTLGLQAIGSAATWEPRHLLSTLTFLALLAPVFVAGSRIGDGGEAGRWLPTQAGAALAPFAFAIAFASRTPITDDLPALSVLVLLLVGVSGWVARRQAAPWLPLGAAAGAFAVFALVALAHPGRDPRSLGLVAAVVAVAAAFHGWAEWSRRRGGLATVAPAAVAAPLGMIAVLAVAAARTPAAGPWPWLAGVVALTAVGYRQSFLLDRSWLAAVAPIAGGTGVLVVAIAEADRHDDLGPRLTATMVGLAVAALAATWLPVRERGRRAAAHGAGAVAALLLIGVLGAPEVGAAGTIAGSAAAAALLLLLAAAGGRSRRGAWIVGAALLAPVAHGILLSFERDRILAIAIALATAAALAAAPLLGALRHSPAAWRGAAVLVGLELLPLLAPWEAVFGQRWIGALPLLLAALAAGLLAAAHRAVAADTPARRVAVVWLAAVGLLLLAAAVPLQLDRQWITVGWALECLALAALWRRLDHPGLKAFSVALGLGVGLRLLANPAVLDYGPAGGWPVVNWILYTYLVPAAALAGAGAIFRPLEIDRLRPREQALYPLRAPLAAATLGLLAVAIGFAWLNLAIYDAFAVERTLRVSFDRQPARDLTLSVAWAGYALLLLGIGTWKARSSLRWVSLGVLLLAIGKVFLHDLGQLEDLYRVASLVGLALCLILVSLLYQRFVFRRESAADGPPSEA